MNTDALMKRLMVLLDGVTDPSLAVEIILPVLKEYGEGIPEEVLIGMAETLFSEILEENIRFKNIGQASVAVKPSEWKQTVSGPDAEEDIEQEPIVEAMVRHETSAPSDVVDYRPTKLCDSIEDGPDDALKTVFYPPLEISTTVTSVGIASTSAVVVPVSERKQLLFGEHMFPRWIVDWGGSPPMSGAQLSPKFLILSPSFRSKPRVQMELDERLICPFWNRTPAVSLETDGIWGYYEQLNISTDDIHAAGREYLLRVRVVFLENDSRDVYCFQGTMRIKTPDLSQTQRTLEISGDGASLINLSGADMAEFQRVRITGGDQTLINIQRGWTASEVEKPEQQHHLVEMHLRPDVPVESVVPRKTSIPITPFYSERIVLCSENNSQTFFIFAKPNLLIGRCAEETLNEDACDIVTRLYHPKFEQIEHFDENLIRASRFLTRLFSRNHCETEVMPRGLRITDRNSTLGTFVAGQQLTNTQILAEWKHLQRGLSIVVGGLLEFVVKAHVDPTWHRVSSLKLFQNEELETFYTQVAFGDALSFHSQGMSGLWKLAVERGNCDSLVFSRRKQLVFERYREKIVRRIHSRMKQPESVLEELESSLRHFLYDPFAKNRKYIVLFRSATIGGGRDDAISLPNSGLSEGIARILSINSMFWIESLQADSHLIRIDDHILKRNELHPLAPNQTLLFGDRIFQVKSFDST